MPIEKKIKNRRVFLLLFSHAIILQDCYILGLPMIIAFWGYPIYAFSYIVLVIMMLLSLFKAFSNTVRNTLFGLAMMGLYLHWYLETDHYAYGTKPFSLKGLAPSIFFQICFFYYLYRTVKYRTVKKVLMAAWVGNAKFKEPDSFSG